LFLKNNVNVDHFIIAKKFEEEINNEIIGSVERQPTKKRPNVLASAIFVFFCYNFFFSKMVMCNKKTFCKTLAF